MNKEHAPSTDYPSKKAKIVAQVADVVSPVATLLTGIKATETAETNGYAALVYGAISLFCLVNTVFRTRELRNERDDLRTKIKPQKNKKT